MLSTAFFCSSNCFPAARRCSNRLGFLVVGVLPATGTGGGVVTATLPAVDARLRTGFGSLLTPPNFPNPSRLPLVRGGANEGLTSVLCPLMEPLAIRLGLSLIHI